METTTKHNNCAALNETNKIITNELIMTIQNQSQKTNPEIGNKTQQNGEKLPSLRRRGRL